MADSQSSVMITGGAGFIGSTLVRQWLEHERERVVNFDKLTYAGLPESLEEAAEHPMYTFVHGDVAEPAAVAGTLLEHRPTTILHLAAESHVDRSISEPPLFAQTNVLGTCVLLDAATKYWHSLAGKQREAFRFVLISTDEVFGSAAPGEHFTTSSPLRPSSPYAASKAAAEHFAQSFAHTYGLPLLIVNPTNHYGPRQFPEKLIPKMILAAAAGEPLMLYGDGLHERDWLNVEDGCRGIRAVARRGIPGKRYLLGSGKCLTNREVVNAICDCLDERLGNKESTRLIAAVADRPGHDRRYAVESAAPELQWQPEVPFNEGIVQTVEWYLENTSWIDAATASLG
ncbi:dTDP-glucose 4,6-dehydratase [Adhaeretor mobilis]|nr:dTDP-glucose 4,6-dehydratase [Adhaeretor mobilis]